jgi:hypothetical protein
MERTAVTEALAGAAAGAAWPASGATEAEVRSNTARTRDMATSTAGVEEFGETRIQ